MSQPLAAHVVQSIAIARAFDRTITEFQQNPYDFLFEADLQARVHAHLFDDLRSVAIRLPWRTRDGIEQIRTIPVKREYPAGVRFDIALVAEGTPRPDLGTTDGNFWNHPCSMACEIKYLQFEGNGSIQHRAWRERWAGHQQDVAKLQHRMEEGWLIRSGVGIAALFVQDQRCLPPGLDWSLQSLLQPAAEGYPDGSITQLIITPTEVHRFVVHNSLAEPPAKSMNDAEAEL